MLSHALHYNLNRMRLTAERVLVGAMLVLSLITLGLQAFVLRPRLWPAGPGLALSGETVMGPLAAPRPVAVIRPPQVANAIDSGVTVLGVTPGGTADRAGLKVGDRVNSLHSIATGTGDDHVRRQLGVGLPPDADPERVLRIWRDTQQIDRAASLELRIIRSDGEMRIERILQPSIWTMDDPPWSSWLRQHLGPLVQMIAFLAGAAVLLLLGAHGTTATFATLALIATAAANSGPLLGSDQTLPIIGTIVLWFTWLITPLSFPIIGLAVLYFPTRAEILDRQKWIIPAVLAACVPMLVISVASAAFLSGMDSALPALAWFATHGWTFEASFALCLAVNVLIIVEGIKRYRVNLDANERRRIQIVVFTVVPAVFAYALKTGIPLLFGLLGRPVQLPWPIEAFLLAVFLLPAFGLPYAVAVKHVLSPRTVLRRSLQYAFARRTLTALVALPVIALVASLVQPRHQSLSMILTCRPLFYLFFLAMLGLGLKYRVAAQRWLDKQFFRAEYDAREILVSLAGRVPYEADPRDLVKMVVTQIDSALHPESIAVFASGSPHGSNPSAAFEPVSALRVEAGPLAV